ncbi:MAG TPA: ThuA domain-containing protein [Candidatus Paceibacterota bacterium]|nr:ThuA domain-containing protein [Candidatus Paceibacterota bacterium]
MKRTLLSLLVGALLLPALASAADAPKKLLVVTTTTGFRHSSIPLSEKVIEDLAKQSGTFTVDFVHQPDGKPSPKRNATPEEKTAFATAEAQWNEKLKQALQKMSPESLKNYDAVAFVSTTGELPIPDPDGFLNWIKNGGAFIGVHAASDTFHRWPAYIEMLGGEFDHHGPQVSVECVNEDLQHPATAHLGKTWTIKQEEIYEFKNYDAKKVHDLLILDKAPQPPHAEGHFPVSWCKQVGKGKIFYTSLGHREDLWDTDPAIRDRKNPEDISKAYRQHVLGGIEWALGLKKGPVLLDAPVLK